MLADWHGDDPRDYVGRSHDARDHCWHATHDLEANQFFVSMITQSRERKDEGLLIWYGEEHVRAERRATAREYKWPIPTPDGCGDYLAAAGRILFDLEWDRATESLARLRQKVGSYVGHFEHYRDAELHHVLFIVPPTTVRTRFSTPSGASGRGSATTPAAAFGPPPPIGCGTGVRWERSG